MANRTELNNALFTVMTTQFKKNMREEVATVEAAGYKVEKYGGVYRVRNPKTDKVVYIDGKCRSYVHTNGNAKGVEVVVWKNDCRVDFVGMLEKPINTEWNELYWRQAGATNYRQKADRLIHARRNVEWKKQDIERRKEQIRSLQEAILRDLHYEAEYEARLTAVRKELGLA